MPFTLAELLPDDQKLHTVQPRDTLATALQLMRQHWYDQLPVVNSDGVTSTGHVVTFKSMLQAMESLSKGSDKLHVHDAEASAMVFPPDADLLSALDDIQREDFVLIVDETGRLMGIVTTADTTRFFREYAQDLMLIEGIEGRMKEAILALYNGDQAALETEIGKVTDRAAEVKAKLPGAIRGYLEKAGLTPPASDDAEAVAEAEKRLKLPEPRTVFNHLTFDEYSQVLLRHPNAPKLEGANDVKEVRTLLDRVRNSRNDLAHFRGKPQPNEREHIKFAARWLETNLPRPVTPLQPAAAQTTEPQPSASQPITTGAQCAEPLSSSGITPTPVTVGGFPREKEDEMPQGSYAALAANLRSQDPSTKFLPVTFIEVDQLLSKGLPKSAYEYRAWWANNPSSPQAAAWLEEGWRASAINMTERKLIFERTNDRENAYIKFFARLNEKLGTEPGFKLYGFSSQGANWNPLATLYIGSEEAAAITASFTRRKEMRVELYIDSGDREKNKHLFDTLHGRREVIEAALGEPLQWDRLDDKRACRVAVYTKGQILTDCENEVLLEWATRRAVNFFKVFSEELSKLPS